jgi:hypothetical protein
MTSKREERARTEKTEVIELDDAPADWIPPVASNGRSLVAGRPKPVESADTERKEPQRIDEGDEPDWPTKTKQGLADGRSIVNVTWFCENYGIQAKFNEFDLRTYVVIDDKTKSPQEAVKDQRELDDPVILEVQHRLHEVNCLATTAAVEAGLRYLGSENRFHPVREYLNGLRWDGKRRLHKLLPHYLNAEDTELNRAIGKAWMIAAVRRIRKPGCKADAVLTLQSPQGTGKSTFFRILASDAWFNDSLEIGCSAKEVIENASGSWIVELAELSNLGRREAEEVKKFISIQHDRARTAYARVAKEVPRQFVLGASVNRSDFLIDETGNRRFWIAVVSRTREEELRRDRNQLWAEAAQLEKAGEPHNIPVDLWPAAEEVAESHMAHDPVADATISVLTKLPQSDAIITASDLFQALTIDDVTKRRGAVGKAVASGAQRAGWVRERMNVAGCTTRCYRSPKSSSREHLYVLTDGKWRKGEAMHI